MTDEEKVRLKYDEKCILDYYGKKQYEKCIEKLEELREAIYLHIVSGYSETTEGHVVEEMADVEVMIAQLKMMLRADMQVDRIKRYKVTRQLNRIEEVRKNEKCQGIS